MSHYHRIEDAQGDLVDLVLFCSDACHRQWCQHNGQPYAYGWDACHELEQIVSIPERCEPCGARLHSSLAEQLEAANRLGQLGNLADVADDLGLQYSADSHGFVTIITDGHEAARVLLTEDGTGIDGFDPCPVPEWAKSNAPTLSS